MGVMNTAESDRGYPGIGRLHYFLGNVSLIAAVVFVVAMFGPESSVLRVTSLLAMIGGVVLDVMRLRNIGVSQWLVFLRFVPLGSTVLAIGLLAAQAGWADTRRLDRAGRSILFAELMLLAIILFLAFRTGLTVFEF